MEKRVVLYSMKGCPHCSDIKKMLKSSNINFVDRDIDIHEKEYDLFVQATGNEYVPSFMLLTLTNSKVVDMKLLSPDDDFDGLEDAVEKVKRYLN